MATVEGEMQLTSARVEQLLKECLFDEGEPVFPRIEVRGILHDFGFHPGRIEEHQEEIHQLLLELPDTFQAEVGGGWSFLNMCIRNDGEQWTGLHMVQEQLMALGVAAGWVSVVSRSLWQALPGGMPYLSIMPERAPVELTEE